MQYSIRIQRSITQFTEPDDTS